MSGKKGSGGGKKRATRQKAKKRKKDVPGIPALPDRRAMEGMMAGFFGGGKDDAVGRAQALMYDAWEASSPGRRVALALKALDISPDCADAFVLLAEEAAETLGDAIALYRKGVEAGERAIGEKDFKEYEGHFWGFLGTRPYMRARAGLAQCLWEAGRREEAVEHSKDMLRLNPNDNQGIRDMLMPCLIVLGRDREAEALFTQYKDDAMASWAYSGALLDFRKSGDSPAAREALAAAVGNNKHVPAYLLGHRKVPGSLPPYHGVGDDSEAIVYVHGNRSAWKATSGALEWLAAQVQ